MRFFIGILCFTALFGDADVTLAQIPIPEDAPRPLSPEESAARFQLPAGFRMEIVASEPLVREPSGVCWDASGRLYVCELHGYNLEGQYDIDELNKTGKLDRVVRRIQADARHKAAAEAETYGTIKRLSDTDGDGRMDHAEVWADRLPPCLGICPARDGIIAACQTEVLFLCDRDEDGRAEVRDVLFEGFQKGPLERSINSPQWGPDNWIYIGAGAGGGTIRGKNLKEPVELPRTDFRIRPDGSMIEPVVGATGTMGHAFAASGERITISTRTPGIFVAPIAWRYLARNPDVPTPSLEYAGTTDQRTWPTSKPHPWRTRRAEDPGFAKYYRDRYGVEESAPNGYFTSACSPFVYQDVALPGLQGQLLACEPAQNLVHRAAVLRDGIRLQLKRVAGEETSEFLTSTDPWFHAIALSHAPDGSVFVVDFYREIIEDYSAIPRYLQQQYGLVAGREHGRLWRLTHADAQNPHSAGQANMSALGPDQLAAEVASPHFWRRQTARRLLIEREWGQVASRLRKNLYVDVPAAAVRNTLETLHGLNVLTPSNVASGLKHPDASIRRRALMLSESWLDSDPHLLPQVLALSDDESPLVRLQLALSLGESDSADVIPRLADLARHHADERWMDFAIMTSVGGHAGQLLAELLSQPDRMGQAVVMLDQLASAIASRHEPPEFSQAVLDVAALDNQVLLAACLRGFLAGATDAEEDIGLDNRARDAFRTLANHSDAAVREPALALIAHLKLETPDQRAARLVKAKSDMVDIRLSAAARVIAVRQLVQCDDPIAWQSVLNALPTATPVVRDAILDHFASRTDRVPLLLDALEMNQIPLSVVGTLQRTLLLDSSDATIRSRAERLFAHPSSKDESDRIQTYVQALQGQRDRIRGGTLFEKHCASCHQAHGIGHAVGPDLNAEFMRSEETIVQDVLRPSDKINPKFGLYAVLTKAGRVANGILAAESPTSLTLRQAEGKEQVILRKNVDAVRAMPVSMMPDDMAETVAPRDLADILTWLRQPPTRLVLLDDNRELAGALRDGPGSAMFISTDRASGSLSLRVTPPQRYAARIPNWSFPIREDPQPGEFRYLRLWWKAPTGAGVMLELADDGRWPAADEPIRRLHAGDNTTNWASLALSDSPPREWTQVTLDLWQEFGDFTLTGMAPTAMGGPTFFDRIELLQAAPDP